MIRALNRTPLLLICGIVLSTILCLGLWPFHAPKNAVLWIGERNGLRFGTYGTIFSARPFCSFQDTTAEVSLEIWAQPAAVPGYGTLLEFAAPGSSSFALGQDGSDLDMSLPNGDEIHRKNTTLSIDDVFRRNLPVFITVTSDIQAVRVYVDGVLAKTQAGFSFSTRLLRGVLVVGDSTGQSDTWSGQLFGLSIYNRKLSTEQVLANYTAWKRGHQPEALHDERNIALYSFDERTGNIVRDHAQLASDLLIPEKYQVLNKIVLEPFWSEFDISWSYGRGVLKNIVGFIPLGFCFYGYLVSLAPRNRALLVTVALGALISLAIEISQGFLPTRDSGTTDILTNTIGTYIGVCSYPRLANMIGRFLPLQWRTKLFRLSGFKGF